MEAAEGKSVNTNSGNANKGRRHYVYMDLLRVAAFAFIILYHFMQELDLEGQVSFAEHGLYYAFPNFHFGTLGVSLFFLLSGAGLMYSGINRFDLKLYFRKRFERIYIPFWLANLCVFLIYFYFNRQFPGAGEDIPAYHIIYTILGVDTYLDNVLGWVSTFTLGVGEWFLGCLIFMYLLFPFLRKCMLKNKWITMGTATVLWLIYVMLNSESITAHTDFFVKLYEFMLGMFLVLAAEKISRKSLIVTVPIILIYVFCPVTIAIPDGIKITVFSLAIYLAVMQLESILSSGRLFAKGLKWCCSCSYEIFLIHHWTIRLVLSAASEAPKSKIVIIGMFTVSLLVMFVWGFAIKWVEDRIICRLHRSN